MGETDLELMSTTEYLYNQLHLKRTYFSSFSPIPDTPLEDVPAGSPKREFRLYEASFLLRDYGFNLEELPFNREGKLPLEVDPKYAWAKKNLLENPVDINKVERHALLRVPGIGPKSAKLILEARRIKKLNNPDELHSFGVNIKRAAPFIILDGKSPSYQMTFL